MERLLSFGFLLSMFFVSSASFAHFGNDAGLADNYSEDIACESLTRSLNRGSRGNDVAQLQEFLASDSSLYPEGIVSGYFGPLTEEAIKRFQIRHNVVTSGTAETTGFGGVGPQTKKALEVACPTSRLTNQTFNSELRIATDKYRISPSGANLANLRSVAQARKGHMSDFIKINPDKALELALSEIERVGLPIDIQSNLEEIIELNGSIEIEHKDYFDQGISISDSFLVDSMRKRYLLSNNFNFAKPQLNTSVKGIQLDDVILLSEEPVVLDRSSLSNLAGLEAKHIAVIRLDIADLPPNSNWINTADIISGLDETSAYYSEVSYGKEVVTYELFGPYISNKPSVEIGCHGILEEAILLSDDDIDFRNYTNIMVIKPIGLTFCASSGTVGNINLITNDGELSIAYSTVSSAASRLMHYMSHELGHNLTMLHASFWHCRTAPLNSGGCAHLEYRDMFDAMGQTVYDWQPGHLNVIHKDKIGYFDPGQVESVTASGSYTITPIAMLGGKKALKIARDDGTNLWIEYRRPLGFDSQIPISALDGIFIRIDKEIRGGFAFTDTLLLDGTPTDDADPSEDNVVFGLGQTFVDPDTGVEITLIAKTDTEATIDINFPVVLPPPPPPPPPPGTPDFPDLFIESLKLSPSTPKLNKFLAFKTKVGNQGETLATSVTAEIQIDENNDGTWEALSAPKVRHLSVKPGSRATATWERVWVAKPGIHRAQICADSDGDVSETDETNNCVVTTFNVGIDKSQYSEGTDLFVESYKLSPSRIRSGRFISLKAKVKNQGLSEVAESQIILRIDEGNDGTWDEYPQTTKLLKSGSKSAHKWRPTWFATPGTHRYEFCVDSGDDISESNEANNCVGGTFVVGGVVTNEPPVSAFSSELSIRSRGNDVINLQQFLIDESYLEEGLTTGYFGTKTRAAVREFQDEFAEDIVTPFARGKWDNTTLRFANDLNGFGVPLSLPSRPETTPPPPPVVQLPPPPQSIPQPTADTTPPTVTIVSPANRATFTKQLIFVSVNASDDSGPLSSVQLINKTSGYQSHPKCTNNICNDFAFPLVVGTNIIRVGAKDPSWNQNVDEIIVTYNGSSVAGTAITVGVGTPVQNNIVQQGQRQVLFNTVRFTAGSDGDVTITALDIEKAGTLSNQSIAGISVRTNMSENDYTILHELDDSGRKTVYLPTPILVKAGKTHEAGIYVWMGCDLSSEVGKTGSLTITGIHTKATVNGLFPIVGAQHTANDSLFPGFTCYPSFEVTSPSQGDSFTIGNTVTFTWGGGTPDLPLNLVIYNEAYNRSYSVVSNTNNDGSESWVIPTFVPPGNYFARISCSACVPDQSGSVPFDDGELFTVIQAPPPAQPDLVVSAVSLFTSSVSPGGSISYSFTRENIGGEGPSGISTWDHMGYLSLDTQYDSSDIALPWTFSVSTYHLSPGWSNSLTKTKPIPSDVPPGSYHLIFREDIGGPPNNYPGVVESNENNNWKASANTVLVQGGSSRIQNDTNLTQMAELLRGLQLLLNQIEYLP